MATEKPRSALPHELLVANDGRHSYMQPMHSLAGPGAYKIPSTFRRPASNLLLRVVQRENYGREFARQKRITAATSGEPDAPCQLCLVTAADTHRARRDQLRKLLQADEGVPSPSERARRGVPDSRTSIPTRAASPDGRARRSPSSRSRSPGSCSSSPSGRQRRASADLADIVADFGDPVMVEEEELPGEDSARVQQQLCAISAPLSYQHFLMSTSYLERLTKQQRRRRTTCSASTRKSATVVSIVATSLAQSDG